MDVRIQVDRNAAARTQGRLLRCACVTQMVCATWVAICKTKADVKCNVVSIS